MRAFDLSPLLRASVGFDDLFGLTESLNRLDRSGQGYPPYNIEKLDEDAYRITMAIAGFSPEELDVTVQDRTLTVSGRAEEDSDEDGREFLYRGIAKRAFERSFRLADTVRVSDASFENGLLTIDLVREVPEHMKPRRIDIQSGNGASAKRIGETADTGKQKAA